MILCKQTLQGLIALAAQLQPAGVAEQAPNKKWKKKKSHSITADEPQGAFVSAAAQPQQEDKRRRKKKSKHFAESLVEQQHPETASTATQTVVGPAASPHHAAKSAKKRKERRDTSHKAAAGPAGSSDRHSQPRRVRGRRVHLLSQVMSPGGCTCACSATEALQKAACQLPCTACHDLCCNHNQLCPELQPVPKQLLPSHAQVALCT